MRYLSSRCAARADLILSILSPPDIPLDTSIKFIDTIGDAYDNAAAETVMGLCQNEAVAENLPSLSLGPSRRPKGLSRFDHVREVRIESGVRSRLACISGVWSAKSVRCPYCFAPTFSLDMRHLSSEFEHGLPRGIEPVGDVGAGHTRAHLSDSNQRAIRVGLMPATGPDAVSGPLIR